jgi:hypothetical protein
MVTVKTSCVVVSISMKRPRETDVPLPSRTSTVIGPGKVAETAAAAAIPPNIWPTKTQAKRVAGIAPMSHNVRLTYEAVSMHWAILIRMLKIVIRRD